MISLQKTSNKYRGFPHICQTASTSADRGHFKARRFAVCLSAVTGRLPRGTSSPHARHRTALGPARGSHSRPSGTPETGLWRRRLTCFSPRRRSHGFATLGPGPGPDPGPGRGPLEFLPAAAEPGPAERRPRHYGDPRTASRPPQPPPLLIGFGVQPTAQ